ncbi:MAG: MFS transporter [Planctomycetota bacterium]
MKMGSPLPRSVWVLSWVSFFADVSGEMIYPLLPLYLVDVLGATKSELGALEGAALLLVALMSATAGIRSDRRGMGARRVPWIRWGYGLPVIGKALIAAAATLPWALAGRLLDRFGKGLRGAPRDALIADAVSAEQRGRAFGLHRALDTAGALVGVLAAALLLWLLNARSPDEAGAARVGPAVYRTVLFVGAALGCCALALTWLVREAPPGAGAPGAQGAPAPGQRAARTTPRARLPRAYWLVLGALLLFALANSSDTFLLLRARELGFTPVQVVLLYAAFNASYSALSYPAGAWSDRFGRWRLIAVGWAVYAVVYAALALSDAGDALGLWPLMVLYGAYMALTEGVGKALIVDQVPATQRGAALGLFYAGLGVAAFVSSFGTGLLWDRFGPTVAFGVGAAFAALAVCALAVAARGTASARPISSAAP